MKVGAQDKNPLTPPTPQTPAIPLGESGVDHEVRQLLFAAVGGA